MCPDFAGVVAKSAGFHGSPATLVYKRQAGRHFAPRSSLLQTRIPNRTAAVSNPGSTESLEERVMTGNLGGATDEVGALAFGLRVFRYPRRSRCEKFSSSVW